MNYEINVSRNGQHYFATAERSLTTHHDMMKMVYHFSIVFPVEEGYKITVTEWNRSGTELSTDKLIRKFELSVECGGLEI